MLRKCFLTGKHPTMVGENFEIYFDVQITCKCISKYIYYAPQPHSSPPPGSKHHPPGRKELLIPPLALLFWKSIPPVEMGGETMFFMKLSTNLYKNSRNIIKWLSKEFEEHTLK